MELLGSSCATLRSNSDVNPGTAALTSSDARPAHTAQQSSQGGHMLPADARTIQACKMHTHITCACTMMCSLAFITESY